MKISHIVIIGFVFLVVIYTISSFVIIEINSNKMKETKLNENLLNAETLRRDLDSFFIKRIDDFRDITEIDEVQEILIESNKEFEYLIDVESFLKEREEFHTTTPFIENVREESISNDLEEIIGFYKSVYEHNVIHELFFTNQFGANVVLGVGTSDYRQDDELWWQEAKTDGLYIGEIENINNEYSIPIGIRVTDDEGNFIGIMRVSLSLDDVLIDLQDDGELLSDEGKNLYLIDSFGRIIFSSDQNWKLYDHYSGFEQIKSGINSFNLESNLENKFVTISKSKTSQEFPGTGWFIVIEQDESKITEEFSDARNEILIIAIIGILAAIIIGLLISYTISKILRSIIKSATDLSQGNFDDSVENIRFYEYRIIQDSFSKASQAIKKLIETEKTLAEAQAKIKNERLAAIGELSSSLAHDLKNPLASIRTGLDAIKRKSKNLDPTLQQEVIPRMENSIKRMSHQIEDVMNYVRVTPANISDNSLIEIVKSAASNFEIPKNIEMIFPKDDFVIKSDKEKIEIVFINLILNAIQAIENDSGKIIISAEKDEHSIKIQIQDDGNGISDEHLGSIFQPLFTTKMKGTGLGLAICKNIIEQHGWTINVKNNPTRFIIIIPSNVGET